MPHKKILITDDVVDNIMLLTFELEDDGFEVLPAHSGAECLEIASESEPDLILLDIRMPEMDGIETLKKLKSNQKTKETPVIMVSANNNDENIIKAIDIGAHDFVSKPIQYPVLAARMRSALRLSEVLGKLATVNQELKLLATLDPLTQVYNRRQFLVSAEREVSRARRHMRDVTFMMLDIDHFKTVNDTYGHATGDQALQSIAYCCKNTCRDTDIIGRLGGEEFAICCPDTNIQGAMQLADRIRLNCNALNLGNTDSPLSVTVSIGVTVNNGTESIDESLKHADDFLYQAKNQGRNQCVGGS